MKSNIQLNLNANKNFKIALSQSRYFDPDIVILSIQYNLKRIKNRIQKYN